MEQFRTILCDPPWPERGGGKIKRGADKHYPLLKVNDIARVMFSAPVWNITDNAHLYMWATSNYLPAALGIMSELGFRYVTNRVWVKMRDGVVQIGLGQYFRHAHELLLFGARGKAMVPEPVCRHSSVIIAERGKHSKKPESVYDNITSASPGPYLEMFARNEREGWTSWGNEITTPTKGGGDE